MEGRIHHKRYRRDKYTDIKYSIAWGRQDILTRGPSGGVGDGDRGRQTHAGRDTQQNGGAGRQQAVARQGAGTAKKIVKSS